MSPLHRHGRDTEAGQQRRVLSQRYSISLTLSVTRREAEASGVGGGKGVHQAAFWVGGSGVSSLSAGFSGGFFCFSLLYLSSSFHLDRITSPHGCMEGNRLVIALASSHDSVTCRENSVRVSTTAVSIHPRPTRGRQARATMALRCWLRKILLHFEPSLQLVPCGHAFSSNRPPSLPPTWRRTCSAARDGIDVMKCPSSSNWTPAPLAVTAPGASSLRAQHLCLADSEQTSHTSS